MKVIGIIAEYNPFHNGHAYQMEAIRRRMNADFIVAAMSGDFVQRGAPAIIDKYARTKMALSCGADLVIELPVLWATASAESFSMAGVTLFEKMGCIDGICFGAETDDLPLLTAIAGILAEEPKSYRLALSSYLREGLNFPMARTRALCGYLGDDPSVMNEPNNILAIEYLKALKRRHSSITPYLLKREGAGYHDSWQPERSDAKAAASATAIRQMLSKFSSWNDPQNPAAFAALKAAVPESALKVLKEYLCDNPPVWSNDFSSILGYLLLSAAPESLAAAGDCNTDIANRLFRSRHRFCTFEDFCSQNKSKDITYTRLSRILLHLILGISNSDYTLGKELDYIPYLRILGFRKNAVPLLTRLKESAAVPVIAKLADASRLLSGDAYALLERDIFASELYRQVRAAVPGSEFSQPIIRL